jgi:hypothetical protein
MTGPVDVPTNIPGPADGPTGDIDALGARFRLLADQDLSGYCPVYDRVARQLAGDPEALDLLVGLVPVNRTPILAFAAVHHLVLSEPSSLLARIYRGDTDDDPWPPFRQLLTDRPDEIRDLMATRSIQTNEVGRSAALLPGLVHAGGRLQTPRGQPAELALVELGPSAGLNLLLDRFHVRYRTPSGAVVAEAGPAESAVRLECELRGGRRPPVPVEPLPIAQRVGLDVEPVDVTVEEECRWLSACVWPGVPDRPQRLAAAVELARQSPPRLLRGDAVTDLEPLLRSLPDRVVPVVVATWVLAYLSAEGRQAVRRAVDAVGGGRDVALLTAEVAHVTPWVPAIDDETIADLTGPDGADADGTLTVLGLRTWRAGRVTDEVLAVTHPHGRWIGWLPKGSS